MEKRIRNFFKDTTSSKKSTEDASINTINGLHSYIDERLKLISERNGFSRKDLNSDIDKIISVVTKNHEITEKNLNEIDNYTKVYNKAYRDYKEAKYVGLDLSTFKEILDKATQNLLEKMDSANLETNDKKIDNVLKESWQQGKGMDIIERTEKCITDIESSLKVIYNNNDLWENIRLSKQNEIKEELLDNVLKESWQQRKGMDIIERTEKCITDIESSLKVIYNNNDLWENIDFPKIYKIKEELLDNVLKESWQQGKGMDIIERTEKCIADIESSLKVIANNNDLWKSIRLSKQDEIKEELLDNVLKESWQQRKGMDIIERTEKCIADIESSLKVIYNNNDLWENIIGYKQDGIKKELLDNVLKESWQQGKGMDIIERTEKYITDIESSLKIIYNNNDLWENIIGYKQDGVKKELLDNVLKESWQQGKGKTFVERSEICQNATQFAGNRIDYPLFEKTIRERLEEKERAMESDIERWKEEKSLPGRGWPGKNYENEQSNERTKLSPSDIKFCESIEDNRGLPRAKLIYWKHGTRASLDIDASELKDSTYERLHPYLSELEIAENEFIQKIKQICLFEYSLGGRRRNEGQLSEEELGIVIGCLADSWLEPPREKYGVLLTAAKEAYKKAKEVD